jgi:outer membrane protein assembly factor BamA
MKRAASLLLAFALFALSASSAQKTTAKGTMSNPGSAYKLTAVKVTGSERYTEKEILPATGLQIGQIVGEEDFKGAVQRLGETGLFADISYSYSYSPTGTKLEFQLTDTAEKNLVPVHFENFVWFSDAELLAELQRRVPLFKQMLPVSGGFPDRLSEALQSMLTDRHAPGHVDYLRQGKQDGGDLTGIAYRVTDVDIRIRNAEFPGAAPEQVGLLKAAAHRLSGAEYNRDALAAVARLDLLPVYLQRGYLKAAFSQSDARVVESASSDEVLVDAILPVTPGKVYSTSDVAWKGNVAIPTAQLQLLIHLPTGQPADAVRLAHDLEDIGKLYRDHGHMMAHVTPVPAMDDEMSTVHYDLNVVEGDQFKMGELELVGLEAQETARLQEAWTLAEGQPYNASYPMLFLQKNFRNAGARVRWKSRVDESVNASDKTVDVTIRFTPE